MSQPNTVPTRVRRQTQTHVVLPDIKPAGDFVYAVFERGWSFDPKAGKAGEWLPDLRTISATPGANGVRHIYRNGKVVGVNMAGALVGVRGKGGTVIQPDDARLGLYQDYVATYPTASGALHHIWSGKNLDDGEEHGERLTMLSSGEVLWNAKDSNIRAEWREFRQVIRDNQVVPPMKAEVYKMKIAQQRKKIELFESQYGDKPAQRYKIDGERDTLVKMQASWKASHGNAPTSAQPKRSRGGSAAKT